MLTCEICWSLLWELWLQAGWPWPWNLLSRSSLVPAPPPSERPFAFGIQKAHPEAGEDPRKTAALTATSLVMFEHFGWHKTTFLNAQILHRYNICQYFNVYRHLGSFWEKNSRNKNTRTGTSPPVLVHRLLYHGQIWSIGIWQADHLPVGSTGSPYDLFWANLYKPDFSTDVHTYA